MGVYPVQRRGRAVLVLVGQGAAEAEGPGGVDAGPDEQGADERVAAGGDGVEGADGQVDERRVDWFGLGCELIRSRKFPGVRDG